MYRQEVPQYGTLLELVAEVNAGQPGFAGDSAERLDLERTVPSASAPRPNWPPCVVCSP